LEIRNVLELLDEIRERMARLGWSQNQLAAEIRNRYPESGIGQSDLSPILAGKREPLLSTAMEIVDTLRNAESQKP
jgi:predicted transcriptional regulator